MVSPEESLTRSLQLILEIYGSRNMESKGKVRATLGSLFKRDKGSTEQPASTEDIEHTFTTELARLDLQYERGELTDRQFRKYKLLKEAVRSVQGQETAESSWRSALTACEGALSFCLETRHKASSAAATLCSNLLRAQRDDLENLGFLLDAENISALDVLRKLYSKVQQAFGKVLKETVADERRLESLAVILGEGPDYLINLALLKAIEIQAREVQDSLGHAVHAVRRRVTKSRAVPATMLEAVSDIRKAAADAQMSSEEGTAVAFSRMDDALDRLQARLSGPPSTKVGSGSPEPPELGSVEELAPSEIVADTSVPFPRRPEPAASALARSVSLVPPSTERPALSRPESSRPPSFTGPDSSLTRQSSIARTPSRDVTPAKTETSPTAPLSAQPEQELYEYGGHILTRSALSLVMLQERMEHADSSGQYAGEVRWDPVRQTWIPVYIKTLRKSDVGEGEVPDRNPANFEIREEDEFGNRIGWSGDQMYYIDDPVFEIRRE